MRLIVLADTRAEGEWAAKLMRSRILTSLNYGLSQHQIHIFSAKAPQAVRGFSLREGDHVFYMDGWDEDEEFVKQWALVERTEQDVWSIHERKMRGPHA